jgi:queuine tRNA-ribosyltransferase
MEVQATLGAEIAMAFDECAPGEATHEEARKSMELTLRWAKRSKSAFQVAQIDNLRTCKEITTEEEPQVNNLHYSHALFGIVQGASHLDLRRESLERTVDIGFAGYAIGGLSVGEERPVMLGVIEEIAPRMPADRPRYLMGVGTPQDLLDAVARGIDMFDCVLPTRNGRTGQAFTSRGKLNVKNACYAQDQRPLDEVCKCSVCLRHSRAFLRHLYLAGEMLASILLTHHNLAFFLDTMRRVRQAIRSGQFTKFHRDYTEQLNSGLE